MTKTNFTKSYKIGRVAPSLSGLSCSLGLEAKPLAGSREQSSRNLLGLRHIKEQNQHSESPLFFIWGFFFFFEVFFYFFLPSVFFSGSAAPVLPWISKPYSRGPLCKAVLVHWTRLPSLNMSEIKWNKIKTDHPYIEGVFSVTEKIWHSKARLESWLEIQIKFV